ncbi:coenzyme F420-0:L-glutamate ligase [Candidatus Peregrinibacteria bacterium]|nr:MAG: coenzyme F420-0:L-glutamate ligase [Candidatus Peregrinibacteria bacterium]
MKLVPLKSPLIQPGDDLVPILLESLANAKLRLNDGDVVVIAGKVIAYSQNRLRTVSTPGEFRAVVDEEADQVVGKGAMRLTIKNSILIPNAGVDHSNAPKAQVVLWPQDPFGAARTLRAQLMTHFGLAELGVLVIDSHCVPLRMGTVGIALGFAGFRGVSDQRTKKDLYGKPMKYTQIAVADNLACAANVLMGETNESTPFVVIQNAPVQMTDQVFTQADYAIEPKDCIFSELYSNFGDKMV